MAYVALAPKNPKEPLSETDIASHTRAKQDQFRTLEFGEKAPS
jgi:hypothetical protein